MSSPRGSASCSRSARRHAPGGDPRRFGQALAAAGGGEYLAGLRDAYAGWCEQLAHVPGEPSIEHNDLHPFNILVAPGGGLRLYDLDDSVVAHPFASLSLPLWWLSQRLGVGAGSRAVARVRDAYLEAFSDLAPHRELVDTLDLAGRVGKATRALVWLRALGPGTEGEEAALRTLRGLLDQA